MGENLNTHASDPAGGQQFAIETLADIRRQALESVRNLNAQPEGQRNPMFLANNAANSAHARAHATVLSYWGELCKERYLDETNTMEFFEEPYTTVQVPRALKEDEHGVISVEVGRPEDSVSPASSDIELSRWRMALDDVGWWINRFVVVRKSVTNAYLVAYQDDTTERVKLVLSPKALSDTFYRLDELAAKFNVLVDVKEASQSPLEV